MSTTAIPTLEVVPQRTVALGIANRRRRATASLRRLVRARELPVSALILDPPRELERHLTWEVLLWLPNLGPERLRLLNARALRRGHVNLAAPLGALTERQREWLAGELQGR